MQSVFSKLEIGSVFAIDPTLKPKSKKPQEEEYTDAKILFFYPQSVDIHERRKQTGISEGIVSFFQPFTDEEDPIECISTLQYTHLIKQVEPNIWLNMVIKHPDTIYGERQSNEVEAETIANNKFHTSLFQEEDSKIFTRVLAQYHQYLCLFHGSIT